MLWSRHFVHYSDAFHYSGVRYSGVSLYYILHFSVFKRLGFVFCGKISEKTLTSIESGDLVDSAGS